MFSWCSYFFCGSSRLIFVVDEDLLCAISGDWIYIIDFLPFFARETTFVTSCLFSCAPNPLWKRVCSKRKEYVPLLAHVEKGLLLKEIFPFRVDLFSEGKQSSFDKSYLPWKCISSSEEEMLFQTRFVFKTTKSFVRLLYKTRYVILRS